MPENLTLNPGDTRSFDAGLASISVGVGSVVVSDGHDSTIATPEKIHNCGGKPSLALYSPDGAVLSLTYADELPAPQEPAERPSGVSAKKRAKKAA